MYVNFTYLLCKKIAKSLEFWGGLIRAGLDLIWSKQPGLEIASFIFNVQVNSFEIP